MNYTELQDYVLAAVEDYSDEIQANFANLTRLAENRIQFELQLPSQQGNDLGSMTQGNRFLAMPTDFLSVYSIFIVDPVNGRQPLLPKDSAFIYEAYPDIAEEGTPRYYGMFNNSTLIIGPTPDDDYVVELAYYQQPESIVDASTSWLGTNAETLLSSAVLVEAYKFIKQEPTKLAFWDSQYKESLARMKNYAEGVTQRDDYRDGQIRVPPT